MLLFVARPIYNWPFAVAASPHPMRRRLPASPGPPVFFMFDFERWVEFLLNHPILVGTFFALLIAFFVNEQRLAGSTLSPAQLVRLVNGGRAVILDLRSTNEFHEGHIVDSINIPFSAIDQRMPELDRHRDAALVLVCKMGQHSGSVGRKLRSAGYEVQRLAGGIAEWRASNLPLVKGG